MTRHYYFIATLFLFLSCTDKNNNFNTSEIKKDNTKSYKKSDKTKPVLVDVFDGVVVFRNEHPEKL